MCALDKYSSTSAGPFVKTRICNVYRLGFFYYWRMRFVFVDEFSMFWVSIFFFNFIVDSIKNKFFDWFDLQNERYKWNKQYTHMHSKLYRIIKCAFIYFYDAWLNFHVRYVLLNEFENILNSIIKFTMKISLIDSLEY